MKQQKVFYQTTPLNNFELAEAIGKANRQDDKIMLLLQHRAPEALTAYQIRDHFHKWPITSVRRSLTNLEKNNLIVLDGYSDGEMGMRVGKYRAAAPSEMKTKTDDDGLIPWSVAIKRVGTQLLNKWIKENRLSYTGKKPKKFSQKDLNKVIMSEFMNIDDDKIAPNAIGKEIRQSTGSANGFDN